jgi:hypothetical protein
MKGPLSLLTTVVALGYGSALIDTPQIGSLCGPRFDLTLDPAARRAYHDIERPQALAEHVRAQQRLLTCDHRQ